MGETGGPMGVKVQLMGVKVIQTGVEVSPMVVIVLPMGVGVLTFATLLRPRTKQHQDQQNYNYFLC